MPRAPGAREYIPGLAGSFSAELHFPWEERSREENTLEETLLKSSPLSCSPRVLQNLAVPERLGQAVIEKLTKVNLSILMTPGNGFPHGWTSH